MATRALSAPTVPRDVIIDFTQTSGTTSVSEQIIKQYTLAPNLLLSARYFSLKMLWAKSGTTDAATSVIMRLGTAGTVADTAFFSNALFVAANRTFNTETMMFASSSTNLRLLTTSKILNFDGSVSAGAYPGDNAVPSLAQQLFLSLTMTMAGVTDTPSIAHVILTLY